MGSNMGRVTSLPPRHNMLDIVTFMAKMWNMGRTETVTGWWRSVASKEILRLSGPHAVCFENRLTEIGQKVYKFC